MDPQFLIVVVPGIGGSVLVDPRSGQEVWKSGVSDVGSLLRHPDRYSVGEHERLVPRGLIRSLTPCGVWTAIRGYEGLLTSLADPAVGVPGAVLDDGSGVPNRDATVVGVGYDFRLGIAAGANDVDRQLQPRLAQLWPDPEDRRHRVIFVAHSMGGLVARYWAGIPENRRTCGMILTLGTPHRGAPKALDVLANGVPAGPFHIRRPRAMLRSWPSIYELLPTFASVYDESAAAAVAPCDLDIGWLRKNAQAATGVHDQIAAWWSDGDWEDGPPVVQPRIGFGHGTTRQGRWDGTRLRFSTDPFDGLSMNRGWREALGDGTVPALSAMPAGRNEPPVDFLEPQRHLDLVGVPTIAAWIRRALDFVDVGPIHGDEKQAVLGVDVPTVVIAGAAAVITARVRRADGSTVPLDGSVAGAVLRGAWAGITTRTQVPLAADVERDVFEGTIPALTPGVYQLTARAERIADLGRRLETREIVEVVDDGLD